jgi:hypothetical protein
MTQTRTMTQLKSIGKRHRWAWEELVYDEKCKEWNSLCGAGMRAMVYYLLQHCQNSPKVAISRVWVEIQLCRVRKTRLVVDFTEKADLIKLVKRYGWIMEEVMMTVKDDETKTLYSQPLSSMYRYLKTRYGTGSEVLERLSCLILTQRRRVKTLHLVSS